MRKKEKKEKGDCWACLNQRGLIWFGLSVAVQLSSYTMLSKCLPATASNGLCMWTYAMWSGYKTCVKEYVCSVKFPC